MSFITFVLIAFVSTSAFAQSTKVAVVKLLRGDVDVLTLGKTEKLKVDDWVPEGAVIKTAEKSFVKLIFTDKSQMNVGPNSEMKIENFSGKDSGVIDLVKGKIRSQVTKDYLQMKDKDKSKLFIKTQHAVMGVRGTDFIIATNKASTSTILFEGEIVFNKLSERGAVNSSRLEDIVDRGVRILPGEFSVMEANRPMPTVPSLLNIQQRDQLEKNREFEADRSPSNTNSNETTKSVVPAGLDGKTVANTSQVLKSEVVQVSVVDPAKSNGSKDDAAGFVKGDQVKPANGSFVHVDSGVIIPPASGSVLDANTNTFIASSESGRVGSDGSYIPPKNVEITNDGKVLITVVDKSGDIKVQQIEKPAPIISGSSVSLSEAGRVIAANPGLINPKEPVRNDILNARFVPQGINDLSNGRLHQNGGVIGINDPAAAAIRNADKVPTTIIVRPEP